MQGAETGGERGSGGRLLEVTEIATTDDKMPREEVLNNTGWTSADAERVCMLWSRPAVCRLAFTGAHQHHHLDHLIILVAPLELSGFGDAAGMEALPRGDWWIFSPFCHDTINCMKHPEVPIVVFVACVQAWRKTHACDHEGDAGAAAGFRRVSGAFAASSTGQLAAGLEKEVWKSYR